jgi:endonuclease YncB( thermonuclease family)
LLAAQIGMEGPSYGAAADELCRVVAVNDTIALRLTCAGGVRDVRLATVRAPRPGTPQLGGEPFAAESRELASGLLTGRDVMVAGGVVRHGGMDVRLELLVLGLVQLADPGGIRQGREELLAAEREARARHRGLWSLAAWRRHLASARQPTSLATPAPRAEEPLAARAARLSRLPWEERKAAFDAALAELAAGPPEGDG